MKLDRAMLCLDCDEVFEIDTRRCPRCSSETMMPLSRFLDRIGAPILKFRKEVR